MAVSAAPTGVVATGRRLAVGAGVALAAFVAGVVLAKAGAIGGPVLMVAAPLVILVAAAALSRPLFGVMAVFASFPIGFSTLPFGSLDLKIVEAAAMAVAGLVVLRRMALGETPLPWRPEMWWALLLVGMALVATPSSVALADSWKQDALLLVGFLYGLAVLAAIRSVDDVRSALGVLLVVGGALCLLGLHGESHLEAEFSGAIVSNRAQGVFPQPNDLGAFASILVLAAVGMALGARTAWSRLGSWAGASAAMLAMGLSLSRGGWIGTALGLLLMMTVLPQARRAAFSVVLPLLLLVSVTFGVLLPSAPPQVEVVKERLGSIAHPEENPYDDRPTIWREAVREIRSDPWTGVGPGAFRAASSKSRSLAITVAADHAHDVLLTVGAEAGLPAVALLIGFTLALALLARRVVRGLPDRGDQAVMAGVACGMAAQIGQGLVDFNLRDPVIFIMMWTLAGMLLAAGRELRRAQGLPAEARA